jgi:hypothetical protein
VLIAGTYDCISAEDEVLTGLAGLEQGEAYDQIRAGRKADLWAAASSSVPG